MPVSTLKLQLLNGFNNPNQFDPYTHGFIGPELIGVQSVIQSTNQLFVVFINEDLLHHAQKATGWVITHYYDSLSQKQLLCLGAPVNYLVWNKTMPQTVYTTCSLLHPQQGIQQLHFSQWHTSVM